MKKFTIKTQTVKGNIEKEIRAENSFQAVMDFMLDFSKKDLMELGIKEVFIQSEHFLIEDLGGDEVRVRKDQNLLRAHP